MEKQKIRIGDFVKIKNHMHNIDGCIGTVLHVPDETFSYYGVKFKLEDANKKSFTYHLHNIGGRDEESLSRWFDENEVELIKAKKGNRNYGF